MKPGADQGSGEVYNAEDGKTYGGNITLMGANALRLEGCVMDGIMCKGQTWTRGNWMGKTGHPACLVCSIRGAVLPRRRY
jgi:uncharacterized protein (DUF2147 family)